jgi:hypothetical protein
VVEGVPEAPQYVLVNEGLVTEHYHGDANHMPSALLKLWKRIVPRNIGARTSDLSAIVQVGAPGETPGKF